MDKTCAALAILSLALFHCALPQSITAEKADGDAVTTPPTTTTTTPKPTTVACDVEQKIRDSLECFIPADLPFFSSRKILSINEATVEKLKAHAYPAKRIYSLLYRHAQDSPEPKRKLSKDKRAEAKRVYDRIKNVQDLTKNMLKHVVESYSTMHRQGVVKMKKGPTQHGIIEDIIDEIFTCDFLSTVIPCIKQKFAVCTDEDRLVSEGMIFAVAEEFKLTNCYIKLETPSKMTLEEGSPPKNVSFSLYRPPSSLCFQLTMDKSDIELVLEGLEELLDFDNTTIPCTSNLFMNVSLSSEILDGIPYDYFGAPECRSTKKLRQAVVGAHNFGTDNFCDMRVTELNWNQTRTFPLAAVIDYQRDRDQEVDFTIDVLIEGYSRNTTVVELSIVDKDPSKVSTCRSINDPHITTFDGHYYNNLYEGFFLLYRHTSLPYEVQVIYQKCNSSTPASCNCAVAVKSGDDVFVVDRCRRKNTNHKPTSQAVLYLNGELTNGTRIFRKDGGLRYDVLLPHGTIVKTVISRDLLNVWVLPSPYDFNQAVGLCGDYDGNNANDLKFPNGTIYNGPGNNTAGQPRPFSKSWRVPAEEKIFKGAREDGSFKTMEYCRCHADLFGSVHSSCGYNMLIETCNLNTEGEITLNISYVYKGSENAVNFTSDNVNNDVIDLDETWEPPELSWRQNTTWNDGSASQHCTNTLNGDLVVKKCAEQFSRFSLSEQTPCKEDIQITDHTFWTQSSIDAARERCMDEILRNRDASNEIGDRNRVNEILAMNCLHDCSGNGQCTNGTCQCNPGYTSGDCSVKLSPPQQTDISSMPRGGLCDLRREDCSVAIVFGFNFVESEKLVCFTKKATAGHPTKPIETQGNFYRVPAVFVSPDQVACRLTNAQSFVLKVSNDGTEPQKELVHTVTDSACYICEYQERWMCSRRQGGHCMIGGACFATNQTRPNDDCQFCDPTSSDSQWADSQEQRCILKRKKAADKKKDYSQEMLIKGVLALVCSLVIIVTTIALFLVHRKKQQAEAQALSKIEILHTNDGLPRKQELHAQEQGYPEKPKSPLDHSRVNSAFTPIGDERPGSPSTPRPRAGTNPLLHNPLIRRPLTPTMPLHATGKENVIIGQNILSDSQREMVKGRERHDSTRDAQFAVVPHGPDANAVRPDTSVSPSDTTKL